MNDYLSADGMVKKRVLKPGSLKKPLEGSVCQLQIQSVETTPSDLDLKALNSEFFTGEKDVELTVNEADCEVDKLVERAVKLMGEDEEAEITITLSSGVVKFTVILVKHSSLKPLWEWTPEEKFTAAVKYKSKAVFLVEENRFVDAFHRFSSAVKLIISMEPISDLELDPNLEKNIQDLRMSLYNNMAMCQLKHGNYEHVIALCSKVLRVQKNNVKAFYRRGTAYGALKDIDKAFFDFQRAIHIQPSNFALWSKLKVYRNLVEISRKRSDELLKKMFCI